MLDPVVLDLADRLVEAPGPFRRGNDVPEPNSPIREPLQPSLVIKRLEVFRDCRSDQSPELICGMRIIEPGCERGVAGEAAEDKQPSIAARDRGKAGIDAHG